MVKVRYKGVNHLLFGKTRINKGENEIPDEEFYKLMKHPSFSARMKTGVLSAPKDFPLEKTRSSKKWETKSPNKEESSQEKQELTEESADSDHLEQDQVSERKLLKNIHKSEDLEYLKNVAENDDREKVKEAAEKRIEALQAEKK
jgi:alpha-galactosidase/6-phospho-beta-glucosidase family protein